MMTHDQTQSKIAQTLRKLMERELLQGRPPRFAGRGLSLDEQVSAWAAQPDHPDSLRITQQAVELHGRKGATLREDVRRQVFLKLRGDVQRGLGDDARQARSWLDEIEREWRGG